MTHKEKLQSGVEHWLSSILDNLDNIENTIKSKKQIDLDELRKDLQEQFRLIILLKKVKEGKVILKGVKHPKYRNKDG